MSRIKKMARNGMLGNLAISYSASHYVLDFEDFA